MRILRTGLRHLRRHWPTACIATVVAVILIREAPRGHADMEPLSLHPYVQQVAHTDSADKSTVKKPAQDTVGT